MAVEAKPTDRLAKARAKAQEFANANGMPYMVYEQGTGKAVIMVAKPGTEEGGPVLYIAYPEADVDDEPAADLPTTAPEAHALGVQAQQGGATMADCPYKQTDPLNEHWMRGYAESKLNAATGVDNGTVKVPPRVATSGQKATGRDGLAGLPRDVEHVAGPGQELCQGCHLPFPVKLLQHKAAGISGYCKLCVERGAHLDPDAPPPTEVVQAAAAALTDAQVAALFGAKSAAALVAEADDIDMLQDDDLEAPEVNEEEPVAVAAPARKPAKAAPAPPPAKGKAKAQAAPAPAPAPKVATKAKAAPAPAPTPIAAAKTATKTKVQAAPPDMSDMDGIFVERVNRATKLPVAIIDANANNPLDPAQGPWALRCPHTIHYCASKSTSFLEARTPQDWCADCAKAAANS